MTDFQENEVFDFARCQRPDGSTYGTSGVCRKGTPISAAKVGELVQKAKAMGYNDADIKAVADRVREKYGVKILKGDALQSVGRRLGEQDGVAPKGKAKAAPKKKAEPKAKKEKTAPKKKDAKKVAGEGPQTAKNRHEKIARDVMADKKYRSDKQRIDEMVRRGVPKNTDFVALVADAKANQPTPKAAPKAKAAPKEAKAKKPSTYSKDKGKEIAKPEEAGLKPGVTKPSGRGKGYDPETKWDAKGNKEMGSGAFGAVKSTKGPPPGIIKKGDIGEFEAEAIMKLQGIDGVPTFQGQNVTGPVKEARFNVGGSVATAPGYLAMSKADGAPISLGMANGYFKRKPEAAVQAMDEYIRLRKEMHMRGVAHNDMHSGNFFYDAKTGKGSIVDFGLAQISPRAAFFEAFGTDGAAYGPDFQSTRFRDFYNKRTRGKGIESQRLYRFEQNKLRAIQRLEELGYNPRGNIFPETRTNLRTGRGIRGKWENLTDEQATEVLGILYDGV